MNIWNYIKQKLQINDKAILDIGGNTGFFTFELLELSAKSVHYFEGNKIHAEFVTIAADILKLKNKVNIYNEYYSFSDINIGQNMM